MTRAEQPSDSKQNNPETNWNQHLSTNWPAALFLSISPFVAIAITIWYSLRFGVTTDEILLFVGMYFITGLGITAGYHRYFSHRTHDAHPILELFYLIAGAAVMQQSLLLWARNHRIHHRYADTPLDPHNIKQGFFHAHMGWIFLTVPWIKIFPLLRTCRITRA